MGTRPLLLIGPYPELIDNDCACPDSGTPPFHPRSIPTDGLWQLASGLHRQPLPNSHLLLFNPLGPTSTIVLNPEGHYLLDSFHTPRPLTPLAQETEEEATFLRELAALGLIHPVGQRPTPSLARPQTLTVWLHVTNACNLDCPYCYLNKDGQPMSEETGRAAVNATFRSAQQHGFSTVKLKYAGGEATLNFRLVQTLHAYARQQASQMNLGLRAVVLSNGVALSPAMIDFLKSENISLMISLDGLGESHDQQRAFRNGRGSFRRVSHAIDKALERGLSPHLSITVTAQNAHALADITNFALDRDLRFNFNFYRDNDCSASIPSLQASQARLIEGIQAAFEVIANRLPAYRLIDSLIDRSVFSTPHEYACGAGHNYMVIDQHGSIAQCHMEIERSIVTVQADDPLLTLRQHSTFQNIPVTEKEGCRECAWRYWCAGGCSLLTLRATGRTDIKSPYCHVYQALYPDLLRLEGLRLLKWASPTA